MCIGETISARFARSDHPELTARYLSVATVYGDTTNSCSYVISEETDSITIDVPFVGAGCNTTKEVSSVISAPAVVEVEWRAPSGMNYGEGSPLSSLLGGLGAS